MVPAITPAKAIVALDAGTALAVDVREPDEFASGHILDAVNLPLDAITPQLAAEVLPDKDALLYIYCRTGRRSVEAAEKLERLGYTNLHDLGGILSWPYELADF